MIEKTLNTSSNNLRLHLYHNYFEKVLSFDNPNLEEAFLKEFIDDYFSCVGKFDVWGVNPDGIKRLLDQLRKVSLIKVSNESFPTLNSETNKIENQLDILTLILDGKDLETGETHKALFPLMDKEAPEDFYGLIESVTVRINKTTDNDKFIIVPSEKEIEKKISKQCKTSWLLALDLSKEYVKKPFKHHEILISFDKRIGFYEGNSLGIALTLTFLEEILKFYNPAYIIRIKEQSAFTGGVTEEGKVLNTGEEVIKKKVAAVFFSKINSFVFSKYDESYACSELSQLKNKFPDRNLKLIPVEDINDVLNRRDVVDIRKQKAVVRTVKFVSKNFVSVIIAILLTVLLSYLFVLDFDDNPYSFTADGTKIYVKNKNGKVLWEKKAVINRTEIENPTVLKRRIRIIDINTDGRNELLITNEEWGTEKPDSEFERISCYNYNGENIWRYSFKDRVSTNIEELPPFYVLFILDTLTFNGIKSLFVVSGSSQSFSSAIFRIELKTGKRLPGTFWCSGHTSDGIIKDLNNDGKKDILCMGLDNGYEDAVFFGYDIDTTTTVRPTTDTYLIRDYPVAELITYIRFPKTDYDQYKKFRTPAPFPGSFQDYPNRKIYQFITMGNLIDHSSTLWYQIDYNLKDVNIIVDNSFRVIRDSLVVHGKLPLPYTDTAEYVNLQKSKIHYWKKGKWVRRKDLE